MLLGISQNNLCLIFDFSYATTCDLCTHGRPGNIQDIAPWAFFPKVTSGQVEGIFYRQNDHILIQSTAWTGNKPDKIEIDSCSL